MKLKELNIELQTYGELKGQYVGKVEYEDNSGKVVMNLDPEISAALLGFIGPVITKFSHKAALAVEANIFQSVQEAKAGKLIEQ